MSLLVNTYANETTPVYTEIGQSGITASSTPTGRALAQGVWSDDFTSALTGFSFRPNTMYQISLPISYRFRATTTQSGVINFRFKIGDSGYAYITRYASYQEFNDDTFTFLLKTSNSPSGLVFNVKQDFTGTNPILDVGLINVVGTSIGIREW